MCRTLVPSLVAPELTVRVWLIVLVHVIMQQLPLFNVVLVVLLPIKDLPILLTIQPARHVTVSSYVSFTMKNVTMWVPKKEEKIDRDMG